jgi:A/G-specific adenine glycosylase
MFCPFNADCIAYLTGRQGTLPVKSKKGVVRERFFHYFILQRDDQLFMKERKVKDIWSGLYDFPLVESSESKGLDTLALPAGLSEWLARGVVEGESDWLTHVLTHQRVRAKFWHLRYPAGELPAVDIDGAFYSIEEIKQLPKPILINNYLTSRFF